MENCITQTQTAQLAAKAEHLTVEQTAFYNLLSNNTQREAYLASLPVEHVNAGPLYVVHYFKGEKVIGIPTYKLAWTSIGAAKMADIIDAQSADIAAGNLTTAEANAEWTSELVHGDERKLDTGDLDVEGARAARDARDAEYKRTKARANGGADAGFTAVPG